MTAPTCATCRWWHRNVSQMATGECRRYPPKNKWWRWRPVYAAWTVFNDFCGEHTPKGEG